VKLPSYPKYKASGVDWLGEVPTHWRFERLKYSATTNDEALPETADPSLEIRYVDIGSVDPVVGITKIEEMVFEDSPSRARRVVRDGDTIVSTVRTYLRAIAAIENPRPNTIVSTGFAVMRPRKVAPGYMSYALREQGFVEAIVARSVGVSYPAVNASEIGGLAIPLPPRDEQETIADFLDRETARIDALIAKKRTLIERLQEKRTALISRTVTCGLPPAAARAAGLDPNPKLKPSGIDWLGDVPTHWTPKRLRFISPHITVGIVVEPSKYYEDQGIPCLRSLNVRPNELLDQDLVFISPESHCILAKSMVRKGDLVAVRSGQPGTTAVVDDRFDKANCIDLIIIRRPTHGDPTFFSYFLNSLPAQAQFSGGSGGAIQQHFNITMASDLWLLEPPPEEQRAIAAYLDRELERLESMVSAVDTAIERLQESRTALITAAVTGKIDVRSMSARPGSSAESQERRPEGVRTWR
jgi:type I restriction enzyme S subunit